MDHAFLRAVASGVANVLLVLVLAPLCEGVVRKLTARIQSRRGPPLRQPYYDLFKLLGKEDIESGEAPAAQRLAALLSLASVLAVACLVPMGMGAPLQGGGDALLLVYLLTLSGIATLLAGAAAGSTYSLLGMSREMMALIVLDPVLAMAIVVGAIHARSFRLEAVLGGSPYAAALPVSGIVVLVAIVLAFQAFVARVPFDTTEAETELMEGPLAEYSGRKLALFKYGQSARLVVYAGLFVGLFAPWGASLPWALAFPLFWLKVLVVVVLVTVVGATHARFRIDQALRSLAALFAISLGAVVLAAYGY